MHALYLIRGTCAVTPVHWGPGAEAQAISPSEQYQCASLLDCEMDEFCYAVRLAGPVVAQPASESITMQAGKEVRQYIRKLICIHKKPCSRFGARCFTYYKILRMGGVAEVRTSKKTK